MYVLYYRELELPGFLEEFAKKGARGGEKEKKTMSCTS